MANLAPHPSSLVTASGASVRATIAPVPEPRASTPGGAQTQSAVFTLFEGTYHLGAAALFNSLYHAGFRGTCYAGVRGPMPAWTRPQAGGYHGVETTDGFAVRLIPLESSHHLTNVKPVMFKQLWADVCEDVPALFYFDPDIIVKRTWSYYVEWVRHGIALVEDVNSAMPADHPTRRAWEEFMRQAGYASRRSLDRYYNGGFVGARHEHAAFFSQWADLLRQAEASGAAALSAFSQRRDEPPYIRFPDQDALNMTAMATELPLSTAGNAEMDFTPGGTLMSHALGRPKPWARAYLRRAWAGIVPSNADKLFWHFAGAGPIHAFRPHVVRRQRRLLGFASALGRIYRRS